ncbi:hypothetical protein AC579_1309 [Pseudocercospora musae]|uniref:E2 ubiquitin-conjugating enzyme n=1 Tax=Pseudocercospora musae TaxID=113226 RepID=A0A139I6H8_9PEZI|nr:hypothetical protein AC579_1309 [Pseudocercospora musae]
MAGNKRIMKEFAEIQQSPPTGCTIALAKDDDMNLWDAQMEGPPESIYAGGKFHIQVTLPKEYPFKPPAVSFRTKIYHPNVTNDERGAMCLGMLKAEEWKPPNKIKEVLMLVRKVLEAPQPDDAVETGIAEQFRNDYKSYEKNAKDWVQKYAGGK